MLFESEYVVHVDGASRGNPGPASYGFVVLHPSGDVLHEGCGYIGISTNNVAEYTALREALRFILAQKIESVEVRSDSLLLVKQLTGEYKLRSPNLIELHAECKSLLQKLRWYEIKHVRREKNKLADRLANEALDVELLKKNG